MSPDMYFSSKLYRDIQNKILHSPQCHSISFLDLARIEDKFGSDSNLDRSHRDESDNLDCREAFKDQGLWNDTCNMNFFTKCLKKHGWIKTNMWKSCSAIGLSDQRVLAILGYQCLGVKLNSDRQDLVRKTNIINTNCMLYTKKDQVYSQRLGKRSTADERFPNPLFPGPTITNPSSSLMPSPPPRLLDFRKHDIKTHNYSSHSPRSAIFGFKENLNFIESRDIIPQILESEADKISDGILGICTNSKNIQKKMTPFIFLFQESKWAIQDDDYLMQNISHLSIIAEANHHRDFNKTNRSGNDTKHGTWLRGEYLALNSTCIDKKLSLSISITECDLITEFRDLTYKIYSKISSDRGIFSFFRLIRKGIEFLIPCQNSKHCIDLENKGSVLIITCDETLKLDLCKNDGLIGLGDTEETNSYLNTLSKLQSVSVDMWGPSLFCKPDPRSMTTRLSGVSFSEWVQSPIFIFTGDFEKPYNPLDGELYSKMVKNATFEKNVIILGPFSGFFESQLQSTGSFEDNLTNKGQVFLNDSLMLGWMAVVLTSMFAVFLFLCQRRSLRISLRNKREYRLHQASRRSQIAGDLV